MKVSGALAALSFIVLISVANLASSEVITLTVDTFSDKVSITIIVKIYKCFDWIEIGILF